MNKAEPILQFWEHVLLLAVNVCSTLIFPNYGISFLGLGFCTNLAQFFLCFVLAFIFQRDGIFTPVIGTIFALILVRWFMRNFLRRFFAQIFMRRFSCADFWCAMRRFFAYFRADFPQIFLRGFGALKIGVPESRKNADKICRKSAASQRPVPGGVPTPSPLPWADGKSHNSRLVQAIKERARVPITAPWGPKACFRLFQDFLKMKICEKSALRPTSLYISQNILLITKT